MPIPGGAVLLHDDFPEAYDHNKVSLTTDHDGVEVADALESVLAQAGRDYRSIELRTRTWAHLEPVLLERGYTRADNLLMVHADVSGRTRPAGQIVELSLEQRTEAAEAGWRRSAPSFTLEVCRQLGRRISTVRSAADATFFAVLDEDASPMARADLYLYDGLAQVEEVVTEEAYRGRGLATLLVTEATDRAQRAGAEQVFLIADAEDWPKNLYTTLGYRAAQILPTYSRQAAPKDD